MRRFVAGICMVVLGASAAVGVGLGCDAFVNRVGVGDCAGSMPEAVINVAGVFRYSGDGSNSETGNGFSFSGTITFEQEGNHRYRPNARQRLTPAANAEIKSGIGQRLWPFPPLHEIPCAPLRLGDNALDGDREEKVTSFCLVLFVGG